MIDFGMSKPYRDEKTGAHIPFRERGCISGTARYMSLNAHEGGGKYMTTTTTTTSIPIDGLLHRAITSR